MLATEICFADVVAEIPDGVIVVGAEAILYANRAAERMLGYSHGALVGQPMARIIEQPVRIGELARGETRLIAGHALKMDGSKLAMRGAIAAHEGPSSEKYCSILLRSAGATPGEVGHRAEGDREAFLAMAAHQMKSPIQPILVSLRTIEQALRRNVPIPADVLPRAIRQTLGLARLVDSILRDMAAAEGQPLVVRFEEVDLLALVRELVEDFRLASPERSIRFIPSSPSMPIRVRSDRDRIHQIVVSLVDNAIKYSERGRPIAVSLEPGRSGATIRVIDHGIGIPSEVQAQVFHRFFRADNAQHTARGLGIGLYFAHELANRLGAELTVQSREGRGSTFSLWLPTDASRGSHEPQG